jgi:ubiquinone/menaquinone biosynthesis C-methylase UbiE
MMMENDVSRVKRPKERARDSYNRMARCYDTVAGRSEREYRDIGLEKLGVKDGETALDIGFGTGHAVLATAQSVGEKGKVYGIDISDRMLRITAGRVEKAGMSQRVALQREDAAQLPYKDDFFDAVFISFTLELFDTPEIPKVLGHCRRVLKDRGRLCVVSLARKPLNEDEKEPWAIWLYELAHRLFPSYFDCRPIYVRKSLEDAGFDIIEVTEMRMWGLPVDIVLAKNKRNKQPKD